MLVQVNSATSDSRSSKIDHAHAVVDRDKSQSRQGQGVRQDDLRTELVTGNDREHRHPCLRIVVVGDHGEAPEMGRRPQKQHQREQQGFDADGRIDGCGSGEYGEAAGQPANDDIGPGTTFQPHRVDNAIGERAKECVERSPPVGRQSRHHKRNSKHADDGS